MSQFALAIIAGYLIGSIPTAYIFVLLSAKKDIRAAGSGNVGARNVYKVTKSRFLSLLVGIIDLLKGAVAFYAGVQIGGDAFTAGAAAGVAAVGGHNFPVWLGFRGGRGLATAAGFLVTWIWTALVVWLVFWILMRKITGSTHLSNITATLITMSAVIAAKNDWLYMITGGIGETDSIRITAGLLGLLITIKHINAVLPSSGNERF